MKEERTLFSFTKQKMFEKSTSKALEIAKYLSDETVLDKLAEDLAKEAALLWRHAAGAKAFDKEQWRVTLRDAWLRKGSFPVLYRENNIYDKREVVACVLLVAGGDPELETDFLAALCAEDFHYDNRPLYALHYKEGFFRLVIRWNALNGTHISFTEAVASFEAYEADLVKRLKDQWQALKLQYERIEEKDIHTASYEHMNHYYTLCKILWQEEEQWSLPLTIVQQDELQRLIVLMAHVNRFFVDLEKKITGGIATRNLLTRKDTERGTKYCEELIARCCKKETFADAVCLYLDYALPALGEACWKSVSTWMKAYSECGKQVEEYTEYISSSSRIARNKDGKHYEKVSVFYENTPADVNYMSFAVDAEEIRRQIMEQTANTTLVAQLLQPQYHSGGAVFEKQAVSAKQSALSLFLRSYYLWCDGKTRRKSQGIDRVQLPFCDYKRDMVIKYALACGCGSCEEMERFLEFTGYAKLSQHNTKEKLVSAALDWYAALSYEQKKTTSPIEIILTMQRYYLYHLADHCLSKLGTELTERSVCRYVRKYRQACLYETDFPEFAMMGDVAGKQDNLEAYHRVWFLLLLLLKYVSNHTISLEKENTLAQEVLQILFERKDPFETGYLNGYLMYVNELPDVSFEYMEYLSGIYHWDESFTKIEADDKEDALKLLKLLADHLEILAKVKSNNSSELEFLYELWYYIMAVMREFCDVYEDGDYAWEYSVVLNRLQDAVVLWTFAGGCKNFSLSYYEQYYGLNHYAKDHYEADYTTGNRWLRYVHDMKQEQLVWNEIVSDLETINKCRFYIEQNALMEEEAISSMQISLEEQVDVCRNTLMDIMQYLQEKGDVENLLFQLEYLYSRIMV